MADRLKLLLAPLMVDGLHNLSLALLQHEQERKFDQFPSKVHQVSQVEMLIVEVVDRHRDGGVERDRKNNHEDKIAVFGDEYRQE